MAELPEEKDFYKVLGEDVNNLLMFVLENKSHLKLITPLWDKGYVAAYLNNVHFMLTSNVKTNRAKLSNVLMYTQTLLNNTTLYWFTELLSEIEEHCEESLSTYRGAMRRRVLKRV